MHFVFSGSGLMLFCDVNLSSCICYREQWGDPLVVVSLTTLVIMSGKKDIVAFLPWVLKELSLLTLSQRPF